MCLPPSPRLDVRNVDSQINKLEVYRKLRALLEKLEFHVSPPALSVYDQKYVLVADVTIHPINNN